MNTALYLPNENWGKSTRQLIFTKYIFTAIASTAGVVGIFTGPIGLFSAILGGGVLYAFILSLIIDILIKIDRDNKIKAILNVYGDRYSEKELKNIYKNNRKEFNRLYKLSSDEFFRKYIEEQANHKKAQKLIIKLQKRINDMIQKYEKLKEKEEKHKKEILELRDNIKLFEEILEDWKKKG